MNIHNEVFGTGYRCKVESTEHSYTIDIWRHLSSQSTEWQPIKISTEDCWSMGLLRSYSKKCRHTTFRHIDLQGKIIYCINSHHPKALFNELYEREILEKIISHKEHDATFFFHLNIKQD